MYFVFFTTMLFSIIAHELGHLFASLICKVKVNAFSVGFWKPYLHKKMFGIDWRLTPWIFGGYCAIEGETTEERNGLMSQPYYKKCFILLAGVFVNLMIALICYWINYKNVFLGMYIDWIAIKSCFTQNYDELIAMVIYFKPNLFLVQLSMMNFFCFITNLIPWPALDGSYLILYALKPIWKENYARNLQIVTKIGFWSLMLLQVVLIFWIMAIQ